MNKAKKINFHTLSASAVAFFMTIFYPTVSFALGSNPIQDGANSAKGISQPTNLFGSAGVFSTITNTMLYIIGALGVIMLVYGGIRYTISGGDAAKIVGAKNTVLYSIVGLVVALLAYAIINFILGTLSVTNGISPTNI